jgi:hypothetical protein
VRVQGGCRVCHCRGQPLPDQAVMDGNSSRVSSVAAEFGLRWGTPFHLAEAEAKRALRELLRMSSVVAGANYAGRGRMCRAVDLVLGKELTLPGLVIVRAASRSQPYNSRAARPATASWPGSAARRIRRGSCL